MRFNRILLSLSLLLASHLCGAQTQHPYIDALDAEHWNGLVAVESKDQAFAIRFNHFIEVGKGLRFIERGGWDFQQAVTKVGTKKADGSYAELSWKVKSVEATLTWSRIDQNTVIGKIIVDNNTRNSEGIWLEFYAPWLFETTYKAKGNKVTAKRSNFHFTTDIDPTHILPMQFMSKPLLK